MDSKTNKRKPKKFIRTDAHKKKRLGMKWRKPKGLQNKRRLRLRGYARVVKGGYQSNRETKGLIKGLKPVHVSDLYSLAKINKKTEGIIISSNVGSKKKMQILEEAKKQTIIVLNHDIDKSIASIKKAFEDRKKTREEKKKAKDKKAKDEKAKEEAKKAEEAKKKSEEAKKAEEKSEEEVKEVKKKELDKALIKKQ